jgi:hypothetical protein
LYAKRFLRSERGTEKSSFSRWEETSSFYVGGGRLRSPAAMHRLRKFFVLARRAAQVLAGEAPRARVVALLASRPANLAVAAARRRRRVSPPPRARSPPQPVARASR